MSDSSGSLSFASDIKPMFRERDRGAMLSHFDLWSAADVVAHGDAIVAQLSSGSMPCDSSWSEERVARLKAWLADGAKP
jgi:hypothetical protein